MFPTIVGAWVLDVGEAGRRRFCYPKGQSRAAALVEDVGALVRGCPRQGWNWSGREERWIMGDGEIGVEIETALARRVQKPNNVSQQSLSTAVLVSGSCWLLT